MIQRLLQKWYGQFGLVVLLMLTFWGAVHLSFYSSSVDVITVNITETNDGVRGTVYVRLNYRGNKIDLEKFNNVNLLEYDSTINIKVEQFKSDLRILKKNKVKVKTLAEEPYNGVVVKLALADVKEMDAMVQIITYVRGYQLNNYYLHSVPFSELKERVNKEKAINRQKIKEVKRSANNY